MASPVYTWTHLSGHAPKTLGTRNPAAPNTAAIVGVICIALQTDCSETQDIGPARLDLPPKARSAACHGTYRVLHLFTSE
ncbi:uncharacterized protein EI97DRAFT_162310 [Westerdykella ornata]|uniref:Uncharacterized protein n=1 Tax=Westerdykella ornata TaxID=318751 RepID=A0A6A6JBJ5_WESOR|nr:uncharacterized protein EI97DRAFT_162310 [Westerdykella ornata]KAF2273358.1 hypothetical protein EI97DRAFT_162310 [Westerdykella ornata]